MQVIHSWLESVAAMKFWTILALLVAICALFLGVGHTEKTDKTVEQTVNFEDAVNDKQL